MASGRTAEPRGSCEGKVAYSYRVAFGPERPARGTSASQSWLVSHAMSSRSVAAPSTPSRKRMHRSTLAYQNSGRAATCKM